MVHCNINIANSVERGEYKLDELVIDGVFVDDVDCPPGKHAVLVDRQSRDVLKGAWRRVTEMSYK
jgi:hypothetical protein